MRYSELVREEYQNKLCQQYAEKWTGEACKLNGQNAKIVGRLCRFPKIVSLDSPLSAEYNWHTVNRIMCDTKEFSA